MKRFIVLILLGLCGCGQAPTGQKTLQLAFSAPPQTLDPRKSGDFLSSTMVCLLYEGLTRCGANEAIEPGLAERWTVSEDGIVYTFYLRASSWTDGSRVSADDFERSWKTILDPSFASPSAYLLFPIKNGEKFAKGLVDADAVGIFALDENTLQVELERPTPYFLSLTAFPLFLPAPNGGELWNGPFRMGKHRINDEIRLIKNETFWNKESIVLDEIRIQIIPDENTALALFEKGQIDWVGSPFIPLPPDALPFFQDRLHFVPMAASTILTFNTQSFPFSNMKLRKALSFCIDSEEIVSKIAPLGQIVPQRILPPSLVPDQPPLLDQSLAPQSLLQEALSDLGISKDDLQNLVLYYRPSLSDKKLALALQNKWKEVLGLNIEIEQLDAKTHMDRLHRRDYTFAIASWISQFFDPVNILERYRSSKTQKNYAGWENDRYASLLEQAAMELDSQKRLRMLSEAEEIFASELPAFPLYHWAAPCLMNPRVQNIATTPCGGVLFEKFTIEPLSSSRRR